MEKSQKSLASLNFCIFVVKVWLPPTVGAAAKRARPGGVVEEGSREGAALGGWGDNKVPTTSRSHTLWLSPRSRQEVVHFPTAEDVDFADIEGRTPGFVRSVGKGRSQCASAKSDCMSSPAKRINTRFVLPGGDAIFAVGSQASVASPPGAYGWG